jgi:hypothetical protein
VQQVIDAHGYSERRACELVGLNRRTCRRPARADIDREVRERLRELAQQRPRFGSPRLHVLLRLEGLVTNHKRTERAVPGGRPVASAEAAQKASESFVRGHAGSRRSRPELVDGFRLRHVA